MDRRSLLALALALPCITACVPEGVESADVERDGEEGVGVASDAISVAQWSDDKPVDGAATTDAPAVASFAGLPNLVYTGTGSDRLYHRTWNGTDWSVPLEVPGQRSRNRPALASLELKAREKLHMVHLGDTSDDLWWSTYDGVSWTKNEHLAFTSIMEPVMASYEGKLHLFGTVNTLQGDELVPTLWEAEYDGSGWGPWRTIETFVDGAAVAVHEGELVLVTRDDNYLYMSTSTGSGWSQPTLIIGQRSKAAPALASFGGLLHMTHLGDSSNRIWWSTWDGTSWTDNEPIPDQRSRYAPSLAESRYALFQVHIGDTSEKIWYSTFQ